MAKYDEGKADLQQGVFNYFPKSLIAIALISMFGSRKYSWSSYRDGWMKVPDGINRYGSAGPRHRLAEVTDGLYDRESDLLHAAHEAWNALARLELILQTNPVTRAENEKPRVTNAAKLAAESDAHVAAMRRSNVNDCSCFACQAQRAREALRKATHPVDPDCAATASVAKCGTCNVNRLCANAVREG